MTRIILDPPIRTISVGQVMSFRLQITEDYFDDLPVFSEDDYEVYIIRYVASRNPGRPFGYEDEGTIIGSGLTCRTRFLEEGRYTIVFLVVNSRTNPNPFISGTEVTITALALDSIFDAVPTVAEGETYSRYFDGGGDGEPFSTKRQIMPEVVIRRLHRFNRTERWLKAQRQRERMIEDDRVFGPDFNIIMGRILDHAAEDREYAEREQKRLDYISRLEALLESSRARRRYPIHAQYHANGSSQGWVDLRIYVYHTANSRWGIVDWTDPTNPVFGKVYDSYPSPLHALDGWKRGNRYPPGQVRFLYGSEVGGQPLVLELGEEHNDDGRRLRGFTFETNERTSWDEVSRILEGIAFATGLLTIAVAIGAPCATGAITFLVWASLFSSAGASTINLAQEADDEFPHPSAALLDALNLAACLFGMSAVSRGAASSVSLSGASSPTGSMTVGAVFTEGGRHWRFLRVDAGDAADLIDGFEGVVIIQERFEELTALMSETAGDDPDERLRKVTTFIARCMIDLTIIAIPSIATRVDRRNADVRSPHIDDDLTIRERVLEAMNDEATIPVDRERAVGGHTDQDVITGILQTNPELDWGPVERRRRRDELVGTLTDEIRDTPNMRGLSEVDQQYQPSRKLREALIRNGEVPSSFDPNNPPSWLEAHHIVEANATHPLAQASRDILSQYGIGLNQPENGVFLVRQSRRDHGSQGLHNELDGSFSGSHDSITGGIHSDEYIEIVHERLTQSHVNSKEQVLRELEFMKDCLRNGEMPPRPNPSAELRQRVDTNGDVLDVFGNVYDQHPGDVDDFFSEESIFRSTNDRE